MGSPTFIPRGVARLLLAPLLCTAAGWMLPATGGAASPAVHIPTDSLYPRQTALQVGASIGAPEAWAVAEGTGVVVAVLDTGVDASHPDLRGALWSNPGEIAGNGIDDDHDGYVDDVHGVDLINHDGDPADDEGHGTHVAGIIAARADGEGVVGLAPKATIMPIKVLDEHRGGDADTLGDGIRYALAHHANVINTSVNGPGTSATLRAALQAAGDAGVTVVASAGNDALDLGITPSYPASYPESAVLAVGATNGDDVLAPFSNFGRGVTLTAPGVAIVSTALGGGYEMRSGTSMAAPEVAAGLALLHSARPDLPDATLRTALINAARKPRGLAGLVSAGSLDVAAAMHQLVPTVAAPPAAEPPVLTARVKRRSASTAARVRSLITWTITGNSSGIRGYRLSLPSGRILARRTGASARGAWVRWRSGRVVVTATGAGGVTVTTGQVRLK